MAKKDKAEATPVVAATKRTPQEKAQRKADKVSRHAAKTLDTDRTENKAVQKQNLKSAAKQLQKELDVRMSEVVARIRKETKDKLKEVVKEATRRLDVDTERMFEQALHTIVRHYDSIAPGRSGDLSFPAPAAQNGQAPENGEAIDSAADSRQGSKKEAKLGKNSSSRKAGPAQDAAADEPTSAKRAGRPAGSTSKSAAAAATSRGPGRPKGTSGLTGGVGPESGTPAGTATDGVAGDNA